MPPKDEVYTSRTPRLRTPDQALESLRNQCARGEKCISDIRRTLYRWCIDPAQHDRIIRSLLSDRFVDEQRYASAFVRDKMRFSKWGIHKISAALKAKSIPQPIIDRALEELKPRKMQDKLLENIRRKSTSVKAKNSYDLRDKLIRYGASQGYDFQDVLDAVQQVIGSPDDPEED